MKKKLTYFTIALTVIFMLFIKLPLALTLLILMTVNMMVLMIQQKNTLHTNIQNTKKNQE